MKFKKVVYTDESRNWIDSKGKKHKSITYFIELDNGVSIPIKPVFVNDYTKLDVIVNEVIKSDKPLTRADGKKI